MVILLAQWQVEGHETPELKLETLCFQKREIPISPVKYHLLFGLGGSEIVVFLCIAQLLLEFSERILQVFSQILTQSWESSKNKQLLIKMSNLSQTPLKRE